MAPTCAPWHIQGGTCNWDCCPNLSAQAELISSEAQTSYDLQKLRPSEGKSHIRTSHPSREQLEHELRVMAQDLMNDQQTRNSHELHKHERFQEEARAEHYKYNEVMPQQGASYSRHMLESQPMHLNGFTFPNIHPAQAPADRGVNFIDATTANNYDSLQQYATSQHGPKSHASNSHFQKPCSPVHYCPSSTATGIEYTPSPDTKNSTASPNNVEDLAQRSIPGAVQQNRNEMKFEQSQCTVDSTMERGTIKARLLASMNCDRDRLVQLEGLHTYNTKLATKSNLDSKCKYPEDKDDQGWNSEAKKFGGASEGNNNHRSEMGSLSGFGSDRSKDPSAYTTFMKPSQQTNRYPPAPAAPAKYCNANWTAAADCPYPDSAKPVQRKWAPKEWYHNSDSAGGLKVPSDESIDAAWGLTSANLQKSSCGWSDNKYEKMSARTHSISGWGSPQISRPKKANDGWGQANIDTESTCGWGMSVPSVFKPVCALNSNKRTPDSASDYWGPKTAWEGVGKDESAVTINSLQSRVCDLEDALYNSQEEARKIKTTISTEVDFLRGLVTSDVAHREAIHRVEVKLAEMTIPVQKEQRSKYDGW